MSASQRVICIFTRSVFSSPALKYRTYLFFCCSSSPITPAPSFRFVSTVSNLVMPKNRKGGHREQRWKEKGKADSLSPAVEAASSEVAGGIHTRLAGLSMAEHSRPLSPIQFGSAVLANQDTVQGQKAWKPKSYGTVSEATTLGVEKAPADQIAVEEVQGNRPEATSAGKSTVGLSKLFKESSLTDFTVDNSTYTHAEIRATFYPKFENEKSDQEIRTRMIEMVSKGLATVEVSLKHSGSLFMYAGHVGGAYAKNSYGNIYTAVGVFVLGRMFREGWGAEAVKKQAEFNDFLERNRMCISMELVTAVLGDHGQRPREDYVVVTAVTELGGGKPKFYSTPDIIAFCRQWRLPTNHVWLFSTRVATETLSL